MINLVISVLLVCIAHIVRTYRWGLLVKTYEKPPNKAMLRALSVGYIVNCIVPFKLGELLRAYLAGRKMKNGRGFCLATVIIERYLDLIIVGILFGIFYVFGFTTDGNKKDFIGYCILAAIMSGVLVLAIILKKYVKKGIRAIAGIFNSKIEEKFLRFSWSLIWGFKDIGRRISALKFITSTFLMWGFYILSYGCFVAFLGGADWKKVFFHLFEVNTLFLNQRVTDMETVWYAVFLLTPALILLAVSYYMKEDKNTKESGEYLQLIPHINVDDRRQFLELYFSAQNPTFIDSYLEINRKIYVIRDYSAGSNATTILCNAGGNNFYRKYAFGNDGEKLYEQVEWLQKYKNIVPLPEILQVEKTDEYCYYDMPFDVNAVSLFDYAHSEPNERAWHFIQEALEHLEKSLYSMDKSYADALTIKRYVKEKVSANLNKIYNAVQIKPLLKFEKLLINGIEYRNLSYYQKYLQEDYLLQVFAKDSYSDIHGDLTIENIICVKETDGEDGFYIIDPNTGNIHNSPNLDYAKLLQSIHGNYEFLMATKQIDVSDNKIEFKFIKSDAYGYLLKKMNHYMAEHFSKEKIRSIYFHEIIHWLRLMPYKIEKNGSRAVLFYAGLLMVLDDVAKRFEL